MVPSRACKSSQYMMETGIAQHCTQTEFARRLIESPERFRIVCIEFEQVADQALGCRGRCQIQPVQSRNRAIKSSLAFCNRGRSAGIAAVNGAP